MRKEKKEGGEISKKETGELTEVKETIEGRRYRKGWMEERGKCEDALE